MHLSQVAGKSVAQQRQEVMLAQVSQYFLKLASDKLQANGFRSSSTRHHAILPSSFLSVGDDARLKPYFFFLIENMSEVKEDDEG